MIIARGIDGKFAGKTAKGEGNLVTNGRFEDTALLASGRERRPDRKADASAQEDWLNARLPAHSPAPVGERPTQCQGQAPLSGGAGLDALTRLEIHPAAVCVPVVPNRALTTRFAGLRLAPAAPGSALHSRSAICAGPVRATTGSGWSRPARAVLDGGMAARSTPAGAGLSLSDAWAHPRRPSGAWPSRWGGTSAQLPARCWTHRLATAPAAQAVGGPVSLLKLGLQVRRDSVRVARTPGPAARWTRCLRAERPLRCDAKGVCALSALLQAGEVYESFVA